MKWDLFLFLPNIHTDGEREKIVTLPLDKWALLLKITTTALLRTFSLRETLYHKMDFRRKCLHINWWNNLAAWLDLPNDSSIIARHDDPLYSAQLLKISYLYIYFELDSKRPFSVLLVKLLSVFKRVSEWEGKRELTFSSMYVCVCKRVLLV